MVLQVIERDDITYFCTHIQYKSPLNDNSDDGDDVEE